MHETYPIPKTIGKTIKYLFELTKQLIILLYEFSFIVIFKDRALISGLLSIESYIFYYLQHVDSLHNHILGKRIWEYD